MKNLMKEITRWRNKIDKIDRSIVAQLNRRAQCVDKIGLLKKRMGINVYSPKREKQVLQNITLVNRGPFTRRALHRIFSNIMIESRKFEHVNNKKSARKNK